MVADPMDGYVEERANGCLVVDFCGAITVLDPGRTLTFGRSAELAIDDNQFLHRQLGRFENIDGVWWVANIGRRIELTIYDRRTRAGSIVTPGTSQALPGSDLVVRFVAGRHTYELLLACAMGRPVDVEPPTDTVGVDTVAWTGEQRLLLAILAEELLRGAGTTETFRLPTNRDARTRLGWSEAKFNRKLDNICERLSGAGIRGLDKGVGTRNNLRRRVLATVVVNRGIITADDLHLLAEHERGVRAGAAP